MIFHDCNFHRFLGFYAMFWGNAMSEKCKDQQDMPTFTTLTNKLWNFCQILTSLRFSMTNFILRGYCTPRPYFGRLCTFSWKIKQLWTKYRMDLVRNVRRNSKITGLLQYRPLLWSYSKKCAKINIFHVLNHKSITTWVSENPVQ